ncbi:gluconate 2-dehydrogenase subunit 3 family protein [Phenylobacterium sp. LjRoot225]|uniref:gluconate 2-dehydrogenase subunit 3 family protein n=1 Tax=Phenylobacterium sp. LjRoot225 TaxID=3342285 RepID=UPI003ECE4AB0
MPVSGVLSLDRRALLQRILLLAGAAVVPGAEALAAAPEAGERLLNPTRYALLTAVADTIVPKTDTAGAVDVGVPAQFDALLRNWAAPARRAEIIAALDAIDTGARQSRGKAFAALTPDERHEFLSAHDAAALQPTRQDLGQNPLAEAPSVGDPKTGKLKQESTASRSFMAGPAVASPGYAKLKELIVVLYYFSEPALTQELVYEHAPGEWRPSLPVTPETRASGGAGFL